MASRLVLAACQVGGWSPCRLSGWRWESPPPVRLAEEVPAVCQVGVPAVCVRFAGGSPRRLSGGRGGVPLSVRWADGRELMVDEQKADEQKADEQKAEKHLAERTRHRSSICRKIYLWLT